MTDIPALIQAEAQAQNVDPALALGVWRAEGMGGAGARSPKGAIGPMQLMPETARGLGVDPTDVAQNIHGGVKYLKQQVDAFGKRDLALAAYNAGPGAVQKHGGVPPYPETQKYVRTAMGQDISSGADIFGEPADGSHPASAPAASTASGEDIFADPPGGAAPAPGEDKPSRPATIRMKGGKVVFGDTEEPVPAGQVDTITKLYKGGVISGAGAPGSVASPYVQRMESDTFKPGEFYVGTDNQLHQVPSEKPPGGFGEGLGAGLGDIPNSIMKLIPGHGDSDVWNAMDAHRMIYDASHKGDVGAMAGRFTGQILGSIPAMAGGEAAVGALAARAPTALGPALGFLGGSGGEGAAGVGGLALRTGSQATRGALEGAGGAALTNASDDAPLSSQLATGAATGGLLRGVAFPAASVSRSAFGGKPITGPVADLARTAVNEYGIPMRVSQIRGAVDRKAAVADSEAIGRHMTGYAENREAQRAAFTRAVSNTFGADSDALTPEVMQAAKQNIGDTFNRVAANTTISDTSGLKAAIAQSVKDASQELPSTDLQPIQNLAQNIQSAIKKGTLSGDSYQALTRSGTPLDRAIHNANPNIRSWAQTLRGHLDDALEGAATDDDLSDLKLARWQYKNLMTVKNLAAKAGVDGTINPLLLNGAVNQGFKNRAFTGAGDLGELAQIGQTFMKEPPNSGTADRIAAKGGHMIGGAAGVGALGMMALEHPHLALKIGAATAALGSARAVRDSISGALNRSPRAVQQLLREGAGPGLFGSAARYVVDPSLVPIGVNAARPLLPQFVGSGAVAQPQ